MHILRGNRSSIVNYRRKQRLLADLNGLFRPSEIITHFQPSVIPIHSHPILCKECLSTIQHVSKIILYSVKWQFALHYFDDIVIFSCTPCQYSNHARVALSLHAEAGITLILNKCAFFTNETDYLDYVIHSGRFENANDSTDAIRQLKISTNKKNYVHYSVIATFSSVLSQIFLSSPPR